MYQLTDTDVVLRVADNTFIPDDPGNRDRIEYEVWLADGGVPDPYVPPPPVVPEPTPTDELLYEHENRIRALEGKEPVTKLEFVQTVKGTHEQAQEGA